MSILAKFEQLEPDYLKLNPNGVVPTFVHDGTILIESSAILEYLEEVIPDPALAPGDAVGRARMRAWMRYVDEVPTVAVRVPTFANMLAPMRFAKSNDAEFARACGPAAPAQAVLSAHVPDRFWQIRAGVCRVPDSSDLRTDRGSDSGKTGGPWIMGAQVHHGRCAGDAADRPDGRSRLRVSDGKTICRMMTAWFRRLQERPVLCGRVLSRGAHFSALSRSLSDRQRPQGRTGLLERREGANALLICLGCRMFDDRCDIHAHPGV